MEKLVNGNPTTTATTDVSAGWNWRGISPQEAQRESDCPSSIDLWCTWRKCFSDTLRWILNQAECNESWQKDYIVQKCTLWAPFCKKMTHLEHTIHICLHPNLQAALGSHSPWEPDSDSPPVAWEISHIHSEQLFPTTVCCTIVVSHPQSARPAIN